MITKTTAARIGAEAACDAVLDAFPNVIRRRPLPPEEYAIRSGCLPAVVRQFRQRPDWPSQLRGKEGRIEAAEVGVRGALDAIIAETSRRQDDRDDAMEVARKVWFVSTGVSAGPVDVRALVEHAWPMALMEAKRRLARKGVLSPGGRTPITGA